MGEHKFFRDREAKPGSAGPRRSLECFEQMRARLLGNAGPGVGDLDQALAAYPARRDAHARPISSVTDAAASSIGSLPPDRLAQAMDAMDRFE